VNYFTREVDVLESGGAYDLVKLAFDLRDLLDGYQKSPATDAARKEIEYFNYLVERADGIPTYAQSKVISRSAAAAAAAAASVPAKNAVSKPTSKNRGKAHSFPGRKPLGPVPESSRTGRSRVLARVPVNTITHEEGSVESDS
jgi:hypothetical protein